MGIHFEPHLADIGAAAATAGAATCHHTACVITSEAVTTAAGSDYTLTVTNRLIKADSVVLASVANGSNTTEGLAVHRVQPADGSVVIKVQNKHASAALNGTVVVSLLAF